MQRKNLNVLAFYYGSGRWISVKAVGNQREVCDTPLLRIMFETGDTCEVGPAGFKAQGCGCCLWCVPNAQQSHPQVILIEKSVKRPVPGVRVLRLEEVLGLTSVTVANDVVNV